MTYVLAHLQVAAAAAEPYPVKAIRLIVPFPPSGLSDALARIIGQHLAQEWGQQVVVDMLHVPYKGSPPAVTATLAGEVALVFATTASVLPHIKSGRIRALAVTTAARSPLMPDLPPIADTLPGYDIVLYQGILAPGKTPREIVARLNAGIDRLLARPASKEAWANFGAGIVIASPEEVDARFRHEVAKLAKLAADSGARVD